MKRRYLILAVGFVAFVGIVLGMLAMVPQSGVPKANFDRIEKGMTKDEVEEILGELGFDFPWVGVRSFAWWADNGDLEAFTFDRNGRMAWRFSYRQETIPEKLRRWLRLD